MQVSSSLNCISARKQCHKEFSLIQAQYLKSFEIEYKQRYVKRGTYEWNQQFMLSKAEKNLFFFGNAVNFIQKTKTKKNLTQI